MQTLPTHTTAISLRQAQLADTETALARWIAEAPKGPLADRMIAGMERDIARLRGQVAALAAA